MPKLIDHEQRKKQIAEATWRVILEQGMEGATVRNIAKEADISPGSLRHDFASQEDLLLYAMNLVKENAAARIESVAMQDMPPREIALGILLELVPTNEETRAEMEVWFAFTAYFRKKRLSFDAQHDGIYMGVQHIIRQLDRLHLLKKGVNKDMEAEMLYAMIDGLALHALLDPQRLNKEKITNLLNHYLDSICHFE
ncbi:TetR/AcrR family transcriptional regulator [Paenibacillus puldeungensis]|uniref:TetR/AcrR family transcriptional regulator n=1 Tax=Paenibacillus puldeungensis TaxID=696536 RepID=A0ABW3RRS0_9BACL